MSASLVIQLQQYQVPLCFLLPDVVVTVTAAPIYWTFYIQGSGLPLSVGAIWSGSMYNVYAVLQKL